LKLSRKRKALNESESIGRKAGRAGDAARMDRDPGQLYDEAQTIVSYAVA